MKKLVAYFSASGVTAQVAQQIAQKANSDLYEIKPKVKYTRADLNWMDRNSRTSIEMTHKETRPEIIVGDIDVADYDVIFLGFPIWWYVAPTVINAFLESYSFEGKKIILFATSGESDFGKTVEELQPSAPKANFVKGKVMRGRIREDLMDEIVALG